MRGRARRPVGQLSLAFPKRWGGARKGAGRKPRARPNVPHTARPAQCERHPLHVTLRVNLRSLRSQRVFAVVVKSLRRAARRPERFRVVQFSIQSDHVHLMVEAVDQKVLSRGVQGLCISIARRVNGEIGRRGSLFAGRFHARSLETPRAVRNALVHPRELSEARTAGAARGHRPLLVGAVFRRLARHARSTRRDSPLRAARRECTSRAARTSA